MNDTTPALPAASGGYETTRFNALRHGVLSRYTVLPWEDEGEYRVLLDALAAEHMPQGPTEEHLVEELAGTLWRKRRLRLAEGGAFRRGLRDTMEPFRHTVENALAHLDPGRTREGVAEAIRATPEDTARELADLAEDEACTGRALEVLRRSRPGAYEAALTALSEDTRGWWQEHLDEPEEYQDEGEEPYGPDAEGLRRFLQTKVPDWYATRRKELENRPLIRTQAFGEALDANRLEQLARYEVHLDRKLERMLAMLVRLRELRAGDRESVSQK